MVRVSIVTVCFNSETTLLRTIDSVISQRYENIEHIVIDGGSTDRSLDIIESRRENITHFVSEKDDGVYDAMNKGWKLATGDVIGFLNSDDVLANSSCIAQIAAAMENDKIDAVYGDLELVDSRNHVTRRWISGPFRRFKYHLGWMTPHPATYIRRRLFEQHGGFRSELTVAADYELMLRFFYRHHARVIYLPGTLVRMLTGGASNGSFRSIGRANWQVYKSWRLNRLFTSPTIMITKPLSKLRQLRF